MTIQFVKCPSCGEGCEIKIARRSGIRYIKCPTCSTYVTFGKSAAIGSTGPAADDAGRSPSAGAVADGGGRAGGKSLLDKWRSGEL